MWAQRWGDALAKAVSVGGDKLGAPLTMKEPRPWHRRKLGIAAALLTASVSAILVERYLLAQGGPAFVQTWPYAAAVGCVGLGVLVDGSKGQKRPMVPAGPWPWRHVAPVMVALGGVWMVVSYFPHSNIPAVLPTVRAERFWYFPVIGTSLVLGVVLAAVAARLRSVRVWRMSLGVLLPFLFVSLQAMFAYRHSMDYESDLAFWRSTKNAVPRSAKAHLNYSVMVGARGDLETRLVESKIAMELAPDWPMAAIYTGDTLCRMKRAHDAWPHYQRGFDIGSDERSLIALALQCMHDEEVLEDYDEELRALADKHEGSWLAYLARDTLNNHQKYNGVDPQYRPRGYNEAAKDEVETRFSERSDSEHQKVTVDTFISEAAPEENFGAGPVLLISGTADENKRALIYFDLSAVPQGATIESVVLYVNTTDAKDAGADAPVEVYALTESWVPGEEDGGAAISNWKYRDKGLAWSAFGVGPGSRDPVQHASVVLDQPSTEYPIDLPAKLVQGWVGAPELNYGIVLLLERGSVSLHSSDSPTVDKRPVLAMRYRKP